MKRKTVLLIFKFTASCLALWIVSPAVTGVSGGLKVEEVTPLPTFSAPCYLYVEISHPQDWGEGEIEMAVDGRSAVAERVSGGTGGGRAYAGFYLYPGEPGRKEIEISFVSPRKKARIKTAVDFRSRGSLLLLDHYDGEAVFTQEPLRFLNCFFRDCRVTVNGEERELTSSPIAAGITVLTGVPRFKPGLNTVVYGGYDREGKEERQVINLFFVTDGRLKVGDRFKFGYGYPGSKSGPFFRVELTGDALMMADEDGEASFPTLANGRWPGMRRVFFRTFTAKQAGTAEIAVFKKGHFLGEFEREREIILKVEE